MSMSSTSSRSTADNISCRVKCGADELKLECAVKSGSEEGRRVDCHT